MNSDDLKERTAGRGSGAGDQDNCQFFSLYPSVVLAYNVSFVKQ